jgi:aryl-alcohol dehydrogenase-like predicted oxidoreductase
MQSVHDPKRLVLGTAQLGMNYGIANTTGMPDQDAANAIVGAALDGGIREFDTAQGYGRSEEVLGRALAAHPLREQARIISKFSPGLEDCSVASIRSSVQSSLKTLGVDRLYGLLLHREEHLDFVKARGLEKALTVVMQEGLVEHVGVSVYSPAKALEALDVEILDLVQLPSNVFDSRFLQSGVFDRARALDKTVYIRSVFLQGLLLMEEVPEQMKFAAKYLAGFQQIAKDLGMTSEELALWYAQEAFPKAKVLCGADTPSQVRANIRCWQSRGLEIDPPSIRKGIGNVPERILNPSLW